VATKTKHKGNLSTLFTPENYHPVRAKLEEDHRQKSLEKTRERMGQHFKPNQILGRRATIGCVALEITQRCNLDCSLCYLSEHSEDVKDIPMEEIYRRIDEIKNHYAAGTDVQITGGDPTMRDRKELVQIVRRVRDVGMRPTLMTNGLKASRDLIEELVANGLNDIAFHMDTTFGLPGYKNEMDLNKLRVKYIERVRGLKVAVIFNTTVHKGNFHEVPDLIRFFRKHTDVVGMASFQLQADTGRGSLRQRDDVISLESMRKKINEGAGTEISWDTILVGHPKCHRMGMTLEANGNLYDLNYDPQLFADFLTDFKDVMMDRRDPWRVIRTLGLELLKRPSWFPRAAKYWGTLAWRMKKDLILSRGRVGKLSFFCQNFMDAKSLDDERVHACSFMVMTAKGPVSMCAHNAKRDDYILQPIAVEQGKKAWDPLTGEAKPSSSSELTPTTLPPRNRKRGKGAVGQR
jgi:uncharacterized radical SAM superfamily Fe-S cluster-containing enzyme